MHIRMSTVNEFYLPPIFIHEVFHILGFSNWFFDRTNIAQTIDIAGKQRYAITSPKVVEYAREYFNCPKVMGVPLEDGGSSGSKGSHWEKSIFPQEVMNPQVARPMIISMFSIKLLEDLGWYKGINADQYYVYLKGSGCEAIMGQTCNADSEEYCSQAERGKDHCYTNMMFKGRCNGSSGFTGSCRYMAPQFNAVCFKAHDDNHTNFKFESYGAHSRCVMAGKNTNDLNAACVRTRCENNKVEMKFGEEVFTCPSAGFHNVS